MKQDYVFNKNLKAITKHKPQLLPHIKKPAEFTKLTPLFKADMASEILKIEYKKHNILINHCTTGVVFCVEPFILKALFDKYPTYRHFFLFFPSIQYFNNMLCNYDLSDIIKTESFKPIFGNTELILEQSIMYNCERVDIMHNGIRIFAYQPFDKLNSDKLKMVMAVMDKIAMGIHVNLNTSIIYGSQIFKNDMRSIDKQVKYQTIECLRDKAKGLPVLCIAAGPSLKKQLDFIKSIQDEVYIIAVTAALKPLLKAGIKCDLYTCIDMDDIIEKYFEDVDLKGIKIALEMATYHGVMENHPEADYIIGQSSAAGKSYINKILTSLNIRVPAESRIHGAMTVAMMSIQLANLMGASEVIMVGQDLAYEDTVSHLPGADYSSSVQMIKNKETGQEYLLFEDYGGKKNAAVPVNWVKGYKKKRVPTTAQFVAYRDFMARFFKTTGLHPINCTEGGMHIPECKQMTLKQAYNKHVKGNLTSNKSLPIARHRSMDKKAVTDTVRMLETIQKEFREIRSCAVSGLKELSKKIPNFDIVNKYIKAIKLEHTECSNYISQNNYAGYYLYRYLELANVNGDKIKSAVNRRNQARLLFYTVEKGLDVFIDETERLIKRLEKQND